MSESVGDGVASTALLPAPARSRFLVRCTMLVKPGVGTVHLHARPWSPRVVFEVTFAVPDGRAWLVPSDKVDAVVEATSMFDAMRMLRSSE